jgi:hypothetical protein
MITQLKQDKGRALLLAGLSAGFLLLHMEPAKASVAPLNLPTDFQWSTPSNSQTGGTSISTGNADKSLSYAKSYSSLYSDAWFYYTEIYLNKNLTPPTGNPSTMPQSGGSGGTSSNTLSESADPSNIPLNPFASLSYAKLNSASYSSTWRSDTIRFLNRADHPGDGNPTNVPEPGSLPLLATGLLGLAIIGLKRKIGKI